MLNPVNKAICRTFLCALAFTSFAGAQIVERSRTLADLLQSHPCNSGLAGRHTIVTDCDAADDLGNGEGAFSCFARCDGVDTWAAVSIGGGAGGGGLPGANEVTESMLKVVNACTDEYVLTCETTTGDFEWQAAATGTIGGTLGTVDNGICRADGTGGFTAQGSGLTISDGRTIEGTSVAISNVAFNAGVDVSSDSRVAVYVGVSNQITGWKKNGASDYRTGLRADGSMVWVSSGDPYNTENADSTMFRAAAGVVGIGGASVSAGGALHLNPLASPPRTCDATAEGDIYSDTSHALCWCDASTWQKLSGAGTCA